MSHTLHREGSLKSLEKDYCLLITPYKGCNNIQAEKKIKKFVDIIFDVGPVNFRFFRVPKEGEFNLPVNKQKILNYKNRVYDNTKIRCVFDDKKKIKELIKQINKTNFGLSVTISGPRKEIESILKEINIRPHSINIGMGTYGSLEKLPDPNFRKITTMCGHGLIAPGLVKYMLIKIKAGKISYEDAGIELAKPCICGVFNQKRAEDILREIAPLYDQKGNRINSK